MHTAVPHRTRRRTTAHTLVLAVATTFGLVASANARHDTVSSEQVISMFTGGFFNILSPSDYFGASVAPIGDLDQDGVTDIAVGSPNHDAGGSYVGALWILRMNADGTAKATQKITGASIGSPGSPSLFDGFGSSVATIGDLDGDGAPDIAVGAPGSGSFGAVWIVFLNADGTVKSGRIIDSLTDGQVIWHHARSFGYSIAALGDLDGDGAPDIAVGDPHAYSVFPGGHQEGKVWVLHLNPDGSVKKTTLIGDHVSTGFTGFVGMNYRFGHALARLPDLNGDGVPELAVGVPRDHAGGIDQGAVWVLFMNPDGTVNAQRKISAVSGLFTGVLNPDDVFGSALSCPGDLDGDGVPDLFVGAVNDDDGGFGRGAIWALFLKSNGTVKAHTKVSSTRGGLTGPIDDMDRFGAGLAWLGDLDGDGIGTLAAGAIGWDNDILPNLGALWTLEIDWSCGAADAYGAGCAGSGGFTPSLTAEGCVAQGQPISISVRDALGGATAILVPGASPAAIPFGPGCDLLVQPWPAIAILPLSDGGPGDGTATLDVSIPHTTSPGTVYLQAFVPDLGAPIGSSSSNGLAITIE